MSRELYKRIGPHLDRVRYDGGIETRNMKDLMLLAQSNEELKDFIKLAYCPELTGNKLRVSGLNNYVSKGYDVSKNANDLTQGTAVNQPWLDKIAPTEKMGLKNPNGGSAYLTHPTISFGATDEWTVETVLNWNGTSVANSDFCGKSGAGKVSIKRDSNNKISISGFSSGYELSFIYDTTKLISKNSHILISKEGTSFKLYINGILVDIQNYSNKAIEFDIIFEGYNYANGRLNSKLFSDHIFSKALSASQVAQRASILRSIFPEVESVTIGTQTWAVRNFEAVCTPQGNLISEVQSNATWATSQTLYDNAYAAQSGTVEQKTYAGVKAAAMWCHYNNDPANGAIYGKLYNWFAVKLLQMDIDYYNANNPTTPWGWRVPTQSEFQTLSTYLGGDAVSGGKLKMTGTSYWNSPNTGADNSSGFSALGSGRRTDTGADGLLVQYLRLWLLDNSTDIIYNSNSINYSNLTHAYGISLRLIKA